MHHSSVLHLSRSFFLPGDRDRLRLRELLLFLCLSRDRLRDRECRPIAAQMQTHAVIAMQPTRLSRGTLGPATMFPATTLRVV